MNPKLTHPLEHEMPYVPTSAFIVHANRKQTVSLDLRGLKSDAAAFTAVLTPVDMPLLQENVYALENCGGTAALELSFGAEQEYILLIYADEKWPVAKAFFYALEDDLFGALPMKADFHMHSTCSDGHIECEKVPHLCRRVGLDLMALTDHHKYWPSRKVMELYESIPHEMIICPGEEVHAPENPVHIVSLNGESSVNELFQNDEAAYFAEVREIEKTVTQANLNPEERFSVAASIWIARKIKERGGLAVFCHPYWLFIRNMTSHVSPYTQTKYISDGVEDAIWACGEFEAVEMIGGFGLVEEHYDNNLRSVISYYEHTARGLRLNPVGTSDCHNWGEDVRMGWYYTIAFVRDWSAEGFCDAVRKGKSVAVEDYVTRCTGARAYGDLRLVRYAQFLQRMVYPKHNELCLEESQWMQAALNGDAAAMTSLQEARGRVKAYLESCFVKD